MMIHYTLVFPFSHTNFVWNFVYNAKILWFLGWFLFTKWCLFSTHIHTGSFHTNSTRPWHPWSRICLIIFYSKLQLITRKFLIPCWYFRALVFSLKFLENCCFYKKNYYLVGTFFIKILQKNSKLKSIWLKFCMYT
jgi:hypothetical protein